MLLALNDLRRHIHFASDHRVEFPGISPGVFAQAEVDHLGVAGSVDHDVLWLQVSMGDAAGVNVR